MRAVQLIALIACAFALTACAGRAPNGEDDDRPPDAGNENGDTDDGGDDSLDAGFSDAGFSDAGFSDAGLSDAGLSDAGVDDAGLAPRVAVSAGPDRVVTVGAIVILSPTVEGVGQIDIRWQLVSAPSLSAYEPFQGPADDFSFVPDVVGEYRMRVSVVALPAGITAFDEVVVRVGDVITADPLPFSVKDAALLRDAGQLALLIDDGSAIAIVDPVTMSTFTIDLDEPASAVALAPAGDVVVAAGIAFIDVRATSNGELLRRDPVAFDVLDVEVIDRLAVLTSATFLDFAMATVDIDTGASLTAFGPDLATVAVHPDQSRAYVMDARPVRFDLDDGALIRQNISFGPVCGRLWLRGDRAYSRCGDRLSTSAVADADLVRSHGLSMPTLTNRIKDVDFDPLDERIVMLIGNANDPEAAEPVIRFHSGLLDEIVDEIPVPGRAPRRVFFDASGENILLLSTPADASDPWALETIAAPERHEVAAPFEVTTHTLEPSLPYDIVAATRSGDRIAIASRAPNAIALIDPDAREILQIALPLEPTSLAADAQFVASGHDGKLFRFDAVTGALVGDYTTSVGLRAMVMNSQAAFGRPSVGGASFVRVEFDDGDTSFLELGFQPAAMTLHPSRSRIYGGTDTSPPSMLRFAVVGSSLALAGERDEFTCGALFSDNSHIISRCGAVHRATDDAQDMTLIRILNATPRVDHCDFAQGGALVVSPGRINFSQVEGDRLLIYDDVNDTPSIVELPDQASDGDVIAVRPRFAFFSADGTLIRALAHPRADFVADGNEPTVDGSQWFFVEIINP